MGKHLINWINGSVIIETGLHGWSALIRTVGQLSGFTDRPVDWTKFYHRYLHH